MSSGSNQDMPQRVPGRFAALYLARPRMEYLEASLQSIQRLVDCIFIGESAGAPFDESGLEHVRRNADLQAKLVFQTGDWTTLEAFFTQISPGLQAKGFTHVLLMDPEDVYKEEELAEILFIVRNNPDAAQFQIQVHAYWKNPLYRIAPMDDVLRTIVSRVDAGRSNSEEQTIRIPESAATCHNFSYACPASHVVDRLKHSGQSAASIEEWKKKTWDAWDTKCGMRNLHPEKPARFRAAHRIHPMALPNALAGHPYINDTGNKADRPKPAISLIFVADRFGTRLGEFLQKLAATVPPDCEVIGGAASPDATILSATAGIRVLPVPGAGQDDPTNSWFALAEAATADHLLFVSPELDFEGDWIEGFIAALDAEDRNTVYIPRIQNSIDSGNRAQLFETARGRHFGRQDGIAALEPSAALCWSCSKATARALRTRENLNALRFVRLQDTVLFHTANNAAGDSELRTPAASVRASIVIPIFNNLHLTKACLESIYRNTAPGSYELIIVDNGSTDGSREFFENISEPVRYIRNRRNLFFAKGCNRGGWSAAGENIVFLNNDTLVKPGWLDELLRPFEQDPRIGIAGNKQLFPDPHPGCVTRVWHAGMVIGGDRLPWHVYYGFDADHPLVNQPHDCVSVSGCCLAIRREIFEALGGFDPEFQNGFEDVDLCLRARERGYRIVYTPHSEIVHFVSSSESRFDCEAANMDKFKTKWSHKLVPDEIERYRAAGLLAEPERRTPPRIGFISAFNQKRSSSTCAQALLAGFPEDAYVVLGEFGVEDRVGPDTAQMIRCWDRTGGWYYPLLRWIDALNLNPIHVNFDDELFPPVFLEVLAALKNSGKRIVVTIHEESLSNPLLTGIFQIVDAIAVSRPALRQQLMLAGCDPWKVHVMHPAIPAPLSEDAPALRDRLNISATRRLLVSPGSVTRDSGTLETIIAVAGLQTDASVQYVVLGDPDSTIDPDYLQRCKAAVRKHGLHENVCFMENLPARERLEYLRAADAIVLFRSGNSARPADLIEAVAARRPIVTSYAPAFGALEHASLRAENDGALLNSLRAVLTNPFLALDLSRKAMEYADTHSSRASFECHSRLYESMLNAPGIPGPTALSRYRRNIVQNGGIERIERLYRQLEERLHGAVIEFGTANLELTRHIQSRVSVTPVPEYLALSKRLELETTALTVAEFKASPFVEARFDTILLHLPGEMDAGAAMVLAFLPHLSEDQRLLILVHSREPRAVQLSDRFERQARRFWVERIHLDSELELIDIRSTPRPRPDPLQKPACRDSRSSGMPIRVCWHGPQLVNHSLALVNRELELALLESDRIDLNIAPVGEDTFAESLNARARSLRKHYRTPSSPEADIHVQHQWPPNWIPPEWGRWVVIQPWEYGGVPEEWVVHINRDVDELWTPTNFVRDLYIASGVDPARVHVVPNAVDADLFKPGLAPYPLATRKSFKFLFVGGTIHRKGIDILLSAYRKAFGASDSVTLVVKDMGASNLYNGQTMGERIRQMQSDPAAPEVIYLDKDLSDAEIARLYNACDCLVHPYRGEGFALPVLEAMSCGKPVIVTAGGATDDFVDDTTGFRIPAKKEVFGNRMIGGLKTAGDLWLLEPQEQALAQTMRAVFHEPERAYDTGRRARSKVLAGWTWKHAATRSIERIQELAKRPCLRNLEKADTAVLIEAEDMSAAAVCEIIESLEENSYMQLKIFVRSDRTHAGAARIHSRFPAVRLLEGEVFGAALKDIYAQVRAPFLAIVTGPLRFSKQWLKQLHDVGAATSDGPKIIAPTMNSDATRADEHSFQRFARGVWRSNRGTFEELQEVPSGCALVSWDCVSAEPFRRGGPTAHEYRLSDGGEDQETPRRPMRRDRFADWRSWMERLRENGARVYQARDTVVGLVQAVRPVQAECSLEPDSAGLLPGQPAI